MHEAQRIELHAAAPAKPACGERCNGCGMCCAAEPCPVAHVFLLQFRGRCRAPVRQEDANRYACGMVACPDRHVRWIPERWRDGFGRWFASRIAAGQGCDPMAEIG